MRRRIQLTCDESCGHSRAEHEAFDDGFLVGSLGGTESDMGEEFADDETREDWLTGFSAGRIVYEYGAPRGRAATDAVINSAESPTWRKVNGDE